MKKFANKKNALISILAVFFLIISITSIYLYAYITK